MQNTIASTYNQHEKKKRMRSFKLFGTESFETQYVFHTACLNFY